MKEREKDEKKNKTHKKQKLCNINIDKYPNINQNEQVVIEFQECERGIQRMEIVEKPKYHQ